MQTNLLQLLLHWMSSNPMMDF